VVAARQQRGALAQLEALGEPRGGLYGEVAGTMTQRGWLRALGMVTYEPSIATALSKAIVMSPEVTVRDLYQRFARLRWNMELLWPEFCGVHLPREIAAVDVPVVFVAGAHDQITSPELARAYLAALRAPAKAFHLFTRSGHVACFEEPERFLEVMLQATAMAGDA
jgi:pimeloyl-ACP methyl ester carboxylesterase